LGERLAQPAADAINHFLDLGSTDIASLSSALTKQAILAFFRSNGSKRSRPRAVPAGSGEPTGTVAIVVSGQPPTWNYMTVGFAEGLKATNGSAKLVYSVIGEAAYDDSAGAKRTTEQVLAAGADIVFGMGDGASFGMIEAIRDYNKDHADAPAKFIDVIGDKSKDYSDVLLTSVLFDYSGIYEQMINDLAQGSFGKTYTMDVKNGGVRLLPLPADTDAAITDAVNTAQEAIVAGAIKVDAIGDTDQMKSKLQELGYQ